MHPRSEFTLPEPLVALGFYYDRIGLIADEGPLETRCVYHVISLGYSDSSGYYVLCRDLDVKGTVYNVQRTVKIPCLKVFTYEEWTETLVVNDVEVPRFVKIDDEATTKVLDQIAEVRNGGQPLEPKRRR